MFSGSSIFEFDSGISSLVGKSVKRDNLQLMGCHLSCGTIISCKGWDALQKLPAWILSKLVSEHEENNLDKFKIHQAQNHKKSLEYLLHGFFLP